jgi:hypothetical protein
MYKFSRFLVAATVISAFFFAFSPSAIVKHLSGGFSADPMLKPGEMISEMVFTTGVDDTVPFWILCSSTKENDHSIRVDCGDLSYDKLAIGHTFGVMDLIRQCINWEDFTWEMSLDGHPIDLKAFGVSNIVRPALVSSPSPVREVFKQVRLWDVVLVNPTPGIHRLQGQAQSPDGAATYKWVVNFTVPTERRAVLQSHSQPSLDTGLHQGGTGYQEHSVSLSRR